MSNNSKPSNFDLYKIALDTRNMEIGLFWQRSNYFLVLNTSVAVGFFTVTTEGYQLLISFIGFCVALLWFRVNLGSKYWQSRWESRIQEVEKNMDADINYFSADPEFIKSDVKKGVDFFKHCWFRRQIDRLVLTKPSVSFSMTLLSILFIFLWLWLFAFCAYDVMHNSTVSSHSDAHYYFCKPYNEKEGVVDRVCIEIKRSKDEH